MLMIICMTAASNNNAAEHNYFVAIRIMLGGQTTPTDSWKKWHMRRPPLGKLSHFVLVNIHKLHQVSLKVRVFITQYQWQFFFVCARVCVCG